MIITARMYGVWGNVKVYEFRQTERGEIEKRLCGGNYPTSWGRRVYHPRNTWESETSGTLNNNGRPKFASLEEYVARDYEIISKEE